MTGSRSRSARAAGFGVVALLAVSLAACGDDTGVRSTGADAITAPPTDAVTTTTVEPVATTTTMPTITLPTTTVPPTTTAPPTTVPETSAPTTTEAPPTGWTDGPVPEGALAGCCQFLWTGVPSPAFPDDPTGPLADGLYDAKANVAWSPDAPNLLVVDVRRYDLCNILGDDVCEFGGPYGDDDVSTAPDPVRTFTLTLDEQVRVVLGGFDRCEPVVRTATGDELVELFQAFATAYDMVIGGPLTAGATEDAILAGLAAGPAEGFELADPDCLAGVLTFRSGTAPPLLLQVLTGFEDDGSRPLLTPTDLIRPVSIHIDQGVVTLTVYAGFLS